MNMPLDDSVDPFSEAGVRARARESLVREHLETFLAHVEAGGGASLPQFVKDEFDAFLECGILARLPEAALRRLQSGVAFAPRAGRGA